MKGRACVSLCLLLLVPAVSPLLAALGPRYGGRLAVGVLELPASLEPADALGRDEALTLALVHDTLVRVETDGSTSPALAARWSSAAEGREWTLWLRAGLRFHDGTPVSSADAARAIRRFVRGPSALAPAFAESLDAGPAFRAAATDELAGVSTPGPDRLLLRFPAPPALPLAPLAAMAASVTSAQGAGAGPFVPNLHLPGRRLALIPFADHWAGRPYLDSLDLLVGAGSETLAADLDGGRLDVLSGGRGTSRLASTLLLTMDASRPPFDRSEARDAVDAALDRMEIARLVPGADPARVILTPALLPPLQSGPRSEPVTRLDADVGLAVEREVPPLASQRLVALLSELGLRLRVVPASPSAARAAPVGLRLFAWSPQVPEAALALREISALAGAPASVLEAISAAAQEPDADRRRARLHRAEEALRDSRLVVSLGIAPVSAATRAGVHGIAVDDTGRIRLEDAWVEP
jgi:MarR-like DNA-binding transcriptional regulator SgrR of sgrS sRNA